jgi:hypothetical protein
MARFTEPYITGGSIVPAGFGAFHGAFHSAVDQSTTANVPKAMEFELTDLSQGVTVENNNLGRKTRITTQNLGVYNIAFSAQLHSVGGGGSGTTVQIWLSHNDVVVPDTNTKLAVNNNSPLVVAAWNFFVEADTVPQYFEIFWTTDNANTILEHFSASGGIPATPSVILTVNQVG